MSAIRYKWSVEHNGKTRPALSHDNCLDILWQIAASENCHTPSANRMNWPKSEPGKASQRDLKLKPKNGGEAIIVTVKREPH